jgi:hydrogenase-4 component F
MNPLIPFALLTLAAILAYLLKTEKQLRFLILVSITIVSTLVIITSVGALFEPVTFGLDALWRIDSLNALLLISVSLISVLSAVVSYRYIGIEYQRGILSFSDVRLYYLLFPLFVLSMLAAVMADSLIVLWIAMEGTTLTTAFLVGIYRRKSSLEAAWKYVLLSSMGIGLSLTGLVLMMFAFEGAGLSENSVFLWTNLIAAAGNPLVNTALLKLSFIFVIVGFGTKIGLVPLHAWLPDALSKTPAPISGLLSGALLPVSFFSLLKIKFILDSVLGDGGWTGHFFLFFGVLSIVFSAVVLSIQKNYKRMLAFTAVAEMGFMAFAIGAGPAGVIPVLMHLEAYALLISAAYFLAGDIILEARSTDIENVKGLQRKMPMTSLFFLIVLLLLVAIPPGAFFTTEFFVVGYGLSTFPLLTLLALLGMTIVAIGIIRVAFTMFFDDEDVPTAREQRWSMTHIVAFVEILLVLLLGIFYLFPETASFFSSAALPLLP